MGSEHGTVASYRSGCTCFECRRAWADRTREYRRERQARREQRDDLQHGLLSTYNNWGCRCEPCRKAARDYRRGQADNN